MRKKGFVSPTKAARFLGVHVNTVYSWCKRAESGSPTRLQNVERTRAGYYYIDLNELKALKGTSGGPEDP